MTTRADGNRVVGDRAYGLTCGRPAAIREAGILKGAGLKSIRIVVAVAAALVALSAASSAAALEPPLPGELAKYRQDGSLPRRLARARELGTEGIVPGMLKAAVQRLQRSALGAPPPLQTPPPAWRGMPTKGAVNVLALPISFSDYPAYSSPVDLQDRLFGDGDPAAFPYESVHDYYARSSYGQLDIQGDVLPWYDTARLAAPWAPGTARRRL